MDEDRRSRYVTLSDDLDSMLIETHFKNAFRLYLIRWSSLSPSLDNPRSENRKATKQGPSTH